MASNGLLRDALVLACGAGESKHAAWPAFSKTMLGLGWSSTTEVIERWGWFKRGWDGDPGRVGLPEGTDFYDWLIVRALAKLPESGVVYAAAYARDYDAPDLLDALDAAPLFADVEDARIAAYELSRGNMPRVVLRCEIVARVKEHD